MKYRILLLLMLASFSIVNAQHKVLDIGEHFPLQNEKIENVVDETSKSMDSYKSDNGLLVIFSCNTCPFVVAWEDRYPMISEIAQNNNVGFVLVNSNFAKRDGDDSKESMKLHAKNHSYKWPYLIDDESSLANAFGAQTTPHVFLFDKDLKLVYKGAIDDNYKDASKVEEFYLKNAIESLGKGKEIEVKETRNLGCSIKRKTT